MLRRHYVRLAESRPICLDMLERRDLLSATADIIFLVDESGSQGTGSEGQAVRPWVSLITGELEQKFLSRGIGSDDPNQYGVVAFGTGQVQADNPTAGGPRARAIELPDGRLFGNSSEINVFLSQFNNSGDQEDIWEAASTGIGVDTIMSAYEFRPQAAVHLIAVTDEFRQFKSNMGGTTSSGGSLFFEILDELRHPNITTASGFQILNDAVLTTVAPFDFETDEFGLNLGPNEKLFGLDVHVLDEVNLDLNRPSPNDDIEPGVADDYVIFKFVADPNPNNNVVVAEARSDGSDFMDDPYQVVRGLFDNPCDVVTYLDCGFVNARGVFQPIATPGQFNPFNEPDFQGIGQDNFFAEEYAFLTWEARGTVWEFTETIKDNFLGWIGDDLEASSANFLDLDNDSSVISVFNRTFVDDTFEKIKIQVADFDQDGKVTGSDVDSMLAFHYDPNLSQSQQQKAKYDFDASTTIDVQDAVKLIDEVLKLWVGDANADGLFNQFDIIQVLNAGKYGNVLPATWSEGDWNWLQQLANVFDNGRIFNNRFFIADIISSLVDGGYLAGYQADMIPIWGTSLSLSEQNQGIYFPDWSAADANAPTGLLEDLSSLAVRRGREFTQAFATDWARALEHLRNHPQWSEFFAARM